MYIIYPLTIHTECLHLCTCNLDFKDTSLFRTLSSVPNIVPYNIIREVPIYQCVCISMYLLTDYITVYVCISDI